MQKKPAQPRSGKQLWQAAKKKYHAYHAVTHEFQHRAQEKVGFGVAEMVLQRVSAYAVHATQESAVIEKAAHAIHKKFWRRAVKFIQ